MTRKREDHAMNMDVNGHTGEKLFCAFDSFKEAVESHANIKNKFDKMEGRIDAMETSLKQHEEILIDIRKGNQQVAGGIKTLKFIGLGMGFVWTILKIGEYIIAGG